VKRRSRFREITGHDGVKYAPRTLPPPRARRSRQCRLGLWPTDQEPRPHKARSLIPKTIHRKATSIPCLQERCMTLFWYVESIAAGRGQVTRVAVGFDFAGFDRKRIELGGARGRRDARWESRQTFPRQAAGCAPAHRRQIHGAPCACPTPPVALRPRVPRSRWRPASGHAGSDGGVARCRSTDTWPG